MLNLISIILILLRWFLGTKTQKQAQLCIIALSAPCSSDLKSVLQLACTSTVVNVEFQQVVRAVAFWFKIVRNLHPPILLIPLFDCLTSVLLR